MHTCWARSGESLYEVWEVYGGPRGSLGFVFMRFEKCMGTLGGRLYEVWEVYVDPRGSFI